MLVLSRAKDEVIVIGDDIEVRIVAIRGAKVSVGIVAPRAIPMHRKEIRDAITGNAPARAASPRGHPRRGDAADGSGPATVRTAAVCPV